MRVASVNQDRGIGPDRTKGAAVHLRAMRDAMRSLGAEVVAFDEPDDRRLLDDLERESARAAFNLIYERHALGKAAAGGFAAARGIPHIVEVNAPLAEEASRYRGRPEAERDRQEDARVFRDAELVVAVSNPVARYCIERGAPAHSVQVWPNAVDTEAFHPGACPDALRAELVPHGRVAVGFHGRLRPWHDFGSLVATCVALLETGCELQLVLVGTGDFAAEIDGRIPDDRVTQVGWVDHGEVPSYVAAFDLLPLTYSPEAPCYFSPLKLAEAMACGVVPLVPDLGDLPEAVRHDEDGWVYPAGDLGALADAMKRLVTDAPERTRLQERAALAVRDRTWVGLARRALSVLHSRANG